jgi:hypothetical protein
MGLCFFGWGGGELLLEWGVPVTPSRTPGYSTYVEPGEGVPRFLLSSGCGLWLVPMAQEPDRCSP